MCAFLCLWPNISREIRDVLTDIFAKKRKLCFHGTRIYCAFLKYVFWIIWETSSVFLLALPGIFISDVTFSSLQKMFPCMLLSGSICPKEYIYKTGASSKSFIKINLMFRVYHQERVIYSLNRQDRYFCWCLTVSLEAMELSHKM